MSRPHSLTEGNILTSLMGFALPVLAALFLQTMYGAVDMMIVGQFSHAAEVSAVSTGSWIMQTITTAIVGLAMGTTILLGRKIGEGQPEEAGRVMGASIWIFAVIGLAVTAVMQFLAVPCTAWMRAPKEAFDSTAVYVKICSAGSLFIVAYNLLGSIFRGLGNSRLPLISVSIACLVNIAGDLLLVGVFHMASAGAAIATVFAQAVSVVLSILIIRKQKLPFAFRKESVRYDRQLAGRVVKLGFPIAFQDVLVSISFLVISAIVNTLGVIPSAGVGVAEKLCGAAGAICLRAGHVGFCGPEYRRQETGTGQTGPCIWYTHFSGSGCVPGVFFIFPRRSAGWCVLQGPGGGAGGGRLSAGLCH